MDRIFSSCTALTCLLFINNNNNNNKVQFKVLVGKRLLASLEDKCKDEIKKNTNVSICV